MDKDVRGFAQQRCFYAVKARHQQMYMEVHLLMMYLYRLFAKGLSRFFSDKKNISYDP